MKKTDILQTITDKGGKIISQKATDISSDLKRYLLNVSQVDGEAMKVRNVAFYVENEGKSKEVAYWENSNPLPSKPAPDAIISVVNNYLDKLKTSGGILTWLGNPNIDTNRKTATCNVIVKEDSVNYERKVFIYKDGSNPISHYIYE